MGIRKASAKKFLDFFTHGPTPKFRAPVYYAHHEQWYYISASFRFALSHLNFNTLTASTKRWLLSICPVDSTLKMKWSWIRPSFTLSLNSACLKHSLDTVSFIGSTTTARSSPSWPSYPLPFSLACFGVMFSNAITPLGKHRANFRASDPIIGFVMVMEGISRYDAVATGENFA